MPKRKTDNAAGSGTMPVGSRVKLLWGGYPMEAEVVEDRGNVGYGGRHILRIRLDIDPRDVAEPIQFEIPAEEVTLMKRRSRNGVRKRAG